MVGGHNMKKYILFLIFTSISLMQNSNPSIKYYDGDLERISSTWNDEAKTTFYLAEKISPEKAVFYQSASFLPFMNLGYAYSDNWKEGANLDVVGLALILIDRLVEPKPWNWNDYEDYNDYQDAKDRASVIQTATRLLYVGISLYKYHDVYNKAEEYNDRLFNRLFDGKRPSFSMDYSPQNKLTTFSMHIPIGKY